MLTAIYRKISDRFFPKTDHGRVTCLYLYFAMFIHFISAFQIIVSKVEDEMRHTLVLWYVHALVFFVYCFAIREKVCKTNNFRKILKCFSIACLRFKYALRNLLFRSVRLITNSNLRELMDTFFCGKWSFFRLFSKFGIIKGEKIFSMSRFLAEVYRPMYVLHPWAFFRKDYEKILTRKNRLWISLQRLNYRYKRWRE